MAVFVFKILSIAIRTLARPLINWVTYYNRIKVQESKNKSALFIKNKLIQLGQSANYYNILLNRKIFGLTKDTQVIKPLNPDKALEKGAEIISEFFVYSILLTIPIYEMIKSYKSNKIKEEQKKQHIVNMQNNVDLIIEKNIVSENAIKEIKYNLLNIKNKLN
jgi:hypothetical protein